MEYLIPIYKDGTIKDGTFLHVLDYCKNYSNNKKCRNFYQNISPEQYNHFLTCPNGMSVYCAYSNGKMLCFTCMRGKGSYKKDKAKAVCNQRSTQIVFNPVLEHNQLHDLIMYSMMVEEADAVLEEKRASIDSISHEVKKLNAQIKDRSDDIIQTYADEKVDYLDREELYSLVEKIKTVYPESIRGSGALRALYDNCGEDEALAIRLDKAIRTGKQDGFRNNPVKENRIKRELYKVLGDEDEVERIYKLAVEQEEY